jgi:hypothetical protein
MPTEVDVLDRAEVPHAKANKNSVEQGWSSYLFLHTRISQCYHDHINPTEDTVVKLEQHTEMKLD